MDWHRHFGLLLTDFFTGSPFVVELEKDLSIKKQLLDVVILRNVDGQWRMFGTPWHGEAELSSPQSAPLAGIYLLEQSESTELVPMTGSQAAASLFACTFPLFYDAEALAFTLDCLGRIVGDVPVSTLRFVPDGSVIDCVRSAA